VLSAQAAPRVRLSAELSAPQTLDRKLRQEKDTHTILLRETARLRNEVESHAKRVAKAQEVSALACAFHSCNPSDFVTADFGCCDRSYISHIAAAAKHACTQFAGRQSSCAASTVP
jgi:hypothetical protein